MTRRTPLLALLLALTTLLVACGAGGDEIAADDVRGRAQVADVGPSAIYMTITNDTDEDAELVGVSLAEGVAGYTELHETREMSDGEMSDGEMSDGEMTDGEMTDGDMDGMEGMGGMEMVQVEGIPVPAGESVSLEPGGLHVMVFDLVEDLEDGDTYEATLEFEDGTTSTVEVEVTANP